MIAGNRNGKAFAFGIVGHRILRCDRLDQVRDAGLRAFIEPFDRAGVGIGAGPRVMPSADDLPRSDAKRRAAARVGSKRIERRNQFGVTERLGQQPYRVRRQFGHRTARVDDRGKAVVHAIQYCTRRLATRLRAKLHRHVGCRQILPEDRRIRAAGDVDPVGRAARVDGLPDRSAIGLGVVFAHKRQTASMICPK